MKVIEIDGLDNRVYELVGRYAMDAGVLKEFYGWPITTDKDTKWFMVHEGDHMSKESLMGFAAVKKIRGRWLFTSDYVVVEHRKKGVHKKLMATRLKWCKVRAEGVTGIIADVTQHSKANYLSAGFSVVKEFVNWTKVELLS